MQTLHFAFSGYRNCYGRASSPDRFGWELFCWIASCGWRTGSILVGCNIFSQLLGLFINIGLARTLLLDGAVTMLVVVPMMMMVVVMAVVTMMVVMVVMMGLSGSLVEIASGCFFRLLLVLLACRGMMMRMVVMVMMMVVRMSMGVMRMLLRLRLAAAEMLMVWAARGRHI